MPRLWATQWTSLPWRMETDKQRTLPRKLEERNTVQSEGSPEEGAPELAFVLGGKSRARRAQQFV